MRAFAVAACIALGAVAGRVALPHLGFPGEELAQPLVVITSRGVQGGVAWAIFAATMLAASVAYLEVVKRLRRTESAPLAPVFAASCAALGAALAFPFFLSSDLYAYAGYGALALLGEDPYRVHVVQQTRFTNPAFATGIALEWSSLPACVYGPLFVELAKSIVAAAQGTLATTVFALRGLVCAAYLVTLVLLARAFGKRGSTAVAVIGLNPVVVWTIAEGHNDVLAAAVVACGVVAFARAPLLAGIVAGASALLKATGALAALALAFFIASGPFAVGAFVALAAAATAQVVASGLAGGYQAQVATDFVGTPLAAAALALRGIFALAAAGVALHHLGAGARARALAAGALALWALVPSPYPWYGLWLLPLAVPTLDEAEGPAILAATFCAALRYVPDAVGDAASAPWLGLAAGAIPVVVLTASLASSAWRLERAQKTLST